MRKTIFLSLAPHLWPLALAVLVGCSAEAPDGGTGKAAPPSKSAGLSDSDGPLLNHPPVIRSATIQPNPIIPGEPLRVRVEAEDPDGDPVTFRHQWLLNGERLEGQTQPTLSLRLVKHGDLVAVEVVPLDGKTGGTPYRTEAVVIPNGPLEMMQVVLEPADVRMGDRVTAKVKGADTGQGSFRYGFRWSRNGMMVLESEGEESSLDTVAFARGDVLTVEAAPQDDTSNSRPLRSPPLTIMNGHPKIASAPPATIDGGRYVYDVKATDPEGDPLTYSLETAPPGMTIDKSTGRIEWRIPAETRGTHRARVAVRDDRDGYAFQEFELSLAAPSS